MKSPVINLDANASYGTIPGLAETSLGLTAGALNPSSAHRAGQNGRALIEKARESIALLCGLSGKERIIFSSGATESNNTALMIPFWRGALKKDGAANIVVSSVEHPSVLECAKRLESLGIEVRTVKPGVSGCFEPAHFAAACDDRTVLLSVMLVNNETGQILPVSRIAAAARERSPGILIHSDAVQGAGKMSLKFEAIGADIVTLSGHKIGGLTGCGALIIKKSAAFEPYILGGPQETRHRAGTENLPGIVSFGLAADLIVKDTGGRIAALDSAMQAVKRIILDGLGERIVMNLSPETEVVPNTMNFRIPGIVADDLIVALDMRGVCISSGSACASGKPEPSHVLLAMGLSESEARESIRISVSDRHSAEELEKAASEIVTAVNMMLNNPCKSDLMDKVAHAAG